MKIPIMSLTKTCLNFMISFTKMDLYFYQLQPSLILVLNTLIPVLPLSSSILITKILLISSASKNNNAFIFSINFDEIIEI